MMSIVTPAERDEWWCPKGPCLLCSQPVPTHEPAVMWAGEHSDLFHVACARKMGVHLICDSREAELAGGGHWWKRAVRALRAALMSQEQRAS